ncbi:MAG: histidine phosphatase family protein [Oscillospiraceae bacterium]|jgi:alpha-ribazole phosphatase|nr:histidine phosphatase family protein [Oscillospiraceae bacterium]
MKTYKIHLIRSGYTKGNLEGRYIGHTDEPLCEEGVAAIHDLLNSYAYPKPEAVFCSPLARCLQTAALIYPEREATPIADMIECDFGEFEGHTADELAKYPEFAEWLRGGSRTAPPHGESSGAFTARICACFVKIVDGMLSSGVRETAIVTHGGVIMTLLAAFGLPEMQMHEWRHPPGCGFTVNIIPSVWTSSRKVEVFAEIPLEPDDEYEDEEDELY